MSGRGRGRGRGLGLVLVLVLSDDSNASGVVDVTVVADVCGRVLGYTHVCSRVLGVDNYVCLWILCSCLWSY